MRKLIMNWEEVVEQHRQSGKSIETFCKDIGIHPNTFHINRKKIRHNLECSTESPVVEIKPIPGNTAAPIVINTKKYMISISNRFDDSLLRTVLKVIGELE